jgi:hypothetical protein
MTNSSNTSAAGMFEIIRYDKDRELQWNDFVARSKNGTFLFDRRYMDYHADRFEDHSLLFFLKGRLYAVLPANRVGDTLHSHQGLTYGGLVTDAHATTARIAMLFQEMNEQLKAEGIRRVVYRPTPWIYHTIPAEEDLYAIVEVCKARLAAREVSTTIVADNPVKWATLRTRCLKKALHAGVEVRWTDDYPTFWQILTDNLLQRYGLTPVHSIEEIQLLQSRFPENIRLVGAYHEGRMVGGMVLYVTAQVVHSQYIAASEEGKQLGALDMIMHQLQHPSTLHLPPSTFNPPPSTFNLPPSTFNLPFFDFGKSTEEHGDVLNENLIHQKEGFGGRAVCYDTYAWDTSCITSHPSPLTPHP